MKLPSFVKLKVVLSALVFMAFGILLVPSFYESARVYAACGNVTFQDQNRQALPNGPVIYKQMHVQLSGCLGSDLDNTFLRITVPADVNIQPIEVNLSGGSTLTSDQTFSIPVPQGFEFVYEVRSSGNPNNIIHTGTTVLVENTDTGKLPSSASTGCCSNDSQCKGYFGQSSSCTGDYNGDCQSGRLCAGGAQLAENAACDQAETLGVCVSGTMCRQTKTGAFCLKPCNLLPIAQQYQCLTSRYDFDFGGTQCTDQDPDCNCTQGNFLSGFEDGFVNGGDNSASYCAIQSSDFRSTLFFGEPSTACGVNDNDCAGIVPGPLTANGPVSASVQVGCMDPGQYRLEVGRSDGVSIERVYKTENFEVVAGVQATSVNMGTIEFEQGTISFRVLDGQNNSLCQYNVVGGIPGTNPVTPNPPPPDSSTDFGSRNCPYAISCDSPLALEQYPTLKGILTLICAQDPTAGVFFPDTSNSAKPRDEQNAEFVACSQCIKDRGTWTEAFGCIITTPEGIFTALIRVVLGIMGGVALVRITYLGIITAQSNDDGKIAEARKGVIATLAAVAVIVFAVLILRVIGVNVLDVVPSGFFG
ncbi:MAG: hypothetical protein JNK26_01665 [Candidatus Doudnabacteria bacterium]|nr:hypothetical protein [Candidatus Doudnabacteria bacterium]